MSHFAIIASELKIKQSQVETVVSLLTEGNTIPFIARYRKDKTGSLDEVQIEAIQQKAKQLQEFDDRKAAIVKSITDQEKMTDELLIKINATTSIAQLEDLYLPYKPKRKTKAQTARENGLEPLAQILLKQTDVVVKTEAAKYLNDVVKTEEEALQGARDIIAEQVNEDAIVREKMRFLFNSRAKFISLVLKDKETSLKFIRNMNSGVKNTPLFYINKNEKSFKLYCIIFYFNFYFFSNNSCKHSIYRHQ
jgi:uncharacterized protein